MRTQPQKEKRKEKKKKKGGKKKGKKKQEPQTSLRTLQAAAIPSLQFNEILQGSEPCKLNSLLSPLPSPNFIQPGLPSVIPQPVNIFIIPPCNNPVSPLHVCREGLKTLLFFLFLINTFN